MALIKTAYAHCDLMCGVYDPFQARLEAQSVLNSINKYHDSDDEIFKARAIAIKEELAEKVKQHIWVLWTDYFKPEHAQDHPELHELVWKTAKLAGECKKSVEVDKANELIENIDKVGRIFEQTKDGYDYGRVLENIN